MQKDFLQAFCLLLASSLIIALATISYGTWTVLEHATFDKVLPSIAEAAAGEPWPVARAIIGYLGATLLVHLGFVAALLLAWRGLLPLAGSGRRDRRNLALLLLVLGLAVIMLWNATMYPRSIYATGYATLATHPVATILRYTLTASVLGAAAAGALGFLRQPTSSLWLRPHSPGPWLAGLAAIFLAAGGAIWWLAGNNETTPSTQPHIIIIGVDAVRPEYTGLINPETSLTPAMDAFFTEAASYPRVITPMGRTYVALTSLLTGQEPATHGRRFNLMPGEPGWPDHALPGFLGAAGYRSVYASDDRRFANLDQRHGFDTVIGPKTGVSDFLIASLNDVPLNNVLLATPIGRWLFPHTYANRAAGARYYPEYFDHLLARGLGHAGEEPLFLAVHLTLPHWPFFWADSDSIPADDLPEGLHQSYARALKRVDRQFADLIALLESRGYLKHALVILMSDHGEEHWGDEGWWQAAPGVTRAGFEASAAGHGALAMSMLQNHVFMAWRSYGDMAEAITPGRREHWTSLIDISPTLMHGLFDHHPENADGISLWHEITGQSDPEPNTGRHLFIETGFSPPAILAGLPDLGDLVRQSMGYYDVQPDGRLTLRERMLEGLIHDKQRAVVRDGWILGLVPGHPGGTLAVLGHIESRQWWPLDVEGDPGPPAEAPVADMLQALCEHFSGDGDFRGRTRYCPTD